MKMKLLDGHIVKALMVTYGFTRKDSISLVSRYLWDEHTKTLNSVEWFEGE
jgi:hypothetical protein